MINKNNVKIKKITKGLYYLYYKDIFIESFSKLYLANNYKNDLLKRF